MSIKLCDSLEQVGGKADGAADAAPSPVRCRARAPRQAHALPPPHSTNYLSPTKRGAGARESPLNRFASPRASARFSVFVSGTHGFDYRKYLRDMYALNFIVFPCKGDNVSADEFSKFLPKLCRIPSDHRSIVSRESKRSQNRH